MVFYEREYHPDKSVKRKLYQNYNTDINSNLKRGLQFK